MSKSASIDDNYQGFREDFLTYEQLTRQLRAWADAFPALVHLRSLGATPEGRELWLLTIGSEPERTRPALWVDANMHASELCGTNVALTIAEDLLRAHLDAPSARPAHQAEILRELLVYVMPRMSPDGAEAVLQSGRYMRSTPRDTRMQQQHSHWRCTDIDGDGLALVMRVEDAAGDFVEEEGVMLPRRIEDLGPYYKIYPEGVIENFDGHSIPDPHFLSDNEIDLNRNFPYLWAPENQQVGAGAYATSAPESRAVVDFVHAHPNIFAWLNFHTFGGVFIRPLGDKPDTKMNASDLALYRQVGAWATECTGYPMVSGFEEFTYEPDTPIRGDLSEYAYHQRGCLAYVVELWDLFEQIGAAKQERFVDRYTHLTREDLLALARWDDKHNQGRVMRPWVATEHPQLGAVEVGGIDPRFGLWNPPKEMLDPLCRAQSECFQRVACLAPRLRCELLDIEELADDLHTVRVQIDNIGYLPTYVLDSAKTLDISEPLTLCATTTGLSLVHGKDARTHIGHLDGWGRGLYDGGSALFYARSRGSGSRARVDLSVRGKGSLHLRIGSCRVGWIDRVVEIE